MIRPVLFLVVSTVMALWLGISLFFPVRQPEEGPSSRPVNAGSAAPLIVFCAASNREVMQAIARDYQQEYGVPVEFQFGPSQALLTAIEVSQEGDFYLPADDSYLETAARKGLVDDIIPLARMHVVLGVKKGNPKSVRSFDDLFRPEIRVVQANPEVAAVGKLTRDALASQGKWKALNEKTLTFVSTVTEAANSVKAGAADVAIVYDAILTGADDLEPVEIEEFKETYAEVNIGLVRNRYHRDRNHGDRYDRDRAMHFVGYLAASDRGLKRYREFGFTPVPGFPWKGVPRP